MHPILLYADRLPPCVGGMEMHAGYFIEYFTGHRRFPLVGVVTKDADGQDRMIGGGFSDPVIVFFNSGRWIEDLQALRAAHPHALFVYRTGGNEIIKAPLVRTDVAAHTARQAFWATRLNATINLLITNSAFTEQRLRRIGVQCSFARCVGGVNVEAIPRRPGAPQPSTLFCAARFVPYKNHALLIDVVHTLVARGCNLRLRLAGDGPLLAAAQDQVGRLHLGDHVAFLGVLDNKMACAEIGCADIYIQLSGDVETEVPGGSYLHCEGMGRSILEALSAGTFVIAGPSGALPEVVTSDRGLLVALDSPEVIADRIAPILDSPPHPPPTNVYSWEKVFTRYERLWEGLLATPRHH